jgi:tyrosine-protein kinase Etk/Wzc
MTNSDLKPHHPDFEDDSIDFKRFFSLFLNNWYWFAIALFLLISLAYGINRYSEKIYTVSSSLLIMDEQFSSGGTQLNNIFQGAQGFKSQQNLKNEIGILKSFSLNKRVIDSLPEFHIGYVRVGRRNIVERRLYMDSPFLVVPGSGKSQPSGRVNLKFTPEGKCRIEINGEINIRKEIEFGELFEENGFSFRIMPRNPEQKVYNEDLSNKYLFWFASPASLANQYRYNLQINPIEEAASLVNLTVSGAVAEQEANYLNKLMELYILQGLELKNQTADSTLSFINDQLGIVFKKLSDAEKELEDFRRSNRLIDLSSEGTMIQNRLKENESEKAKLGLQKLYYDYLIKYLAERNETGDIISPSVMGVTDQLLISLIQELAQLQRQKNQLALNLRNESAPVELIDENIRKVKASLNQNIESGISNINSSFSDLNNRILLVEGEIRKLPATEQELIRIQRKFEINNTVYTFLLEKSAETGIARASNVSDNRIIDKATSFNSALVKPKARKNYLMALLFGFLIPGFGILLIDSLNNRIIDKRDVEKGTDAPILGYVSHNDIKTEIPVIQKPGSALAESFRSVRTNLKYFIKESDNPVIAISSTVSSEGKTFISINLASIIALLGKKVLLVGLDLRKPRIHKILEVENGKGVSTFLTGDDNFGEIIQSTEIENLSYAPAGPVPPNPAELIESEKLREFLETAKKKFDFIIIDTPPIAIVTDALLIAPYVDIYLLVVRQRFSSKNTLALIQELYKNKTMKKLGIIINDISLTGYYGYGLRYGSYMGYGYSYGYSYYDAGGYGSYYGGLSKGEKEYYTE